MPIVHSIQSHAASMGAQGKVALARLSLKLGKKLEQAERSDEVRIRALAAEIFGQQF